MTGLVRVLPDTNVCFPISVLDLVLRCDEADLHRVIWTEDLLQELERVWVREGARNSDSAQRICGLIRSTFPAGEIAQEWYVDLVASMPGSDPDDHVHAAAAVAAAPSVLLTANLEDFPAEELGERGVRVQHPDHYFASLLDQHPAEVEQILGQMAADRRRPPMSTRQVVDALERAGLGVFAEWARH